MIKVPDIDLTGPIVALFHRVLLGLQRGFGVGIGKHLVDVT